MTAPEIADAADTPTPATCATAYEYGLRHGLNRATRAEWNAYRYAVEYHAGERVETRQYRRETGSKAAARYIRAGLDRAQRDTTPTE